MEGVPLIGGPLHRSFTVFTCQVLRTSCVAHTWEQGIYKMAHPITIVTLQTKRAWKTCLFATAVVSHVSLLEYFCSYVQDHHPKVAQTTWSAVLVIQTRQFLLFDNGRAVYKRSTKCCGDKSITTFTDSLNFIRLLRVVITPSITSESTSR